MSKASGSKPPVRRSGTGARPNTTQRRASSYVPARRDPFPFIIGGLIGVLVVGIVLVLVLVTSTINTPAPSTVPQVGATQGASTSGNVGNPIVLPTRPLPAAGPGTPVLGTAVLDEGKTHVPDGTTITYKSYPPSSGSHYSKPASYGFSATEIPEGNLVHALEHGAIILYYQPGLPASTIQQIQAAYTTLPPAKYGTVKMVITPYAKLQTPVAVVGWARVLTLPSFDYNSISTFYQEWVDKGPEDVP